MIRKLVFPSLLVGATLVAAPVRAQDEDAPKPRKARMADEKPPEIVGRNDSIREAFKDVAGTPSAWVVKIGASGYGILVDGGFVVTTSAAVKDVRTVSIQGQAGSGEARVVAVDERSAIALLKAPFEGKGGFSLEGAAATSIGQFVLTIGIATDKPLAAGVLSARNRKVEPRDLSQANLLMGLLSDGIDGPKRAYPKVLQHDSPMTDETLGTPLVDSQGRLVGLNVGTGYRGSSYAIATADLAACVAALRSGKPAPAPEAAKPEAAKPEAAKPWLGASVKERTDGELVVEEVAADGPAAKAGLKAGDRITGCDGAKVETLDDLGARIGIRKAGDTVVLSIVRDGKKSKLPVPLGSR